MTEFVLDEVYAYGTPKSSIISCGLDGRSNCDDLAAQPGASGVGVVAPVSHQVEH
jgi:hypothetical protein